MKTYGGGGIAPAFLNLELDGGEWSASSPGRFISCERVPRYPLHRRLCGPQSRSGSYGEEQKLAPAEKIMKAVNKLK
jgi:hypothetical protein